MLFLVDAQLPPALARLLTQHGYTAEHVADIELNEADDSIIWEYALEHKAIVITKDEDFPYRHRQSRKGPVIVWLRIGNASRKALLQWFEPLLPDIIKHIEQGNQIIEVR
ncbi:MAG: DUF5615 family PIN-like protein [Verrucomicrobiaceae bacterium]|nr:DUF5615 family PIN-like protein [Verrucomicrobiaceae bacterium]